MRIHQVFILDEAIALRAASNPGAISRELARLNGEAASANATTTTEDNGATALQALIAAVTREEMPLPVARTITTISVNFAKVVTVAEALPALEARYGGHAASWARAIFPHLKQGPAGVH